ncbi:methyl-accepting chemotaxis protein [Vibrio sp. WJH972]
MFVWSIKKKLSVLLISLITLIMINIFGMFEIAKTGYFTYLEREYLIGVESIQLNLDRMSVPNQSLNEIKSYIDKKNTNFRQQGIVQGLHTTTLQSELCLGAVNFAEDIIFRVLGFGKAIDVCTEAIDTNQQFKSLVLAFQQDNLTFSEFLSQIESPFARLKNHSEEFSVLIPEIRTFMVNLIVTMTIVLSLGLIVAFIFTIKGIQSSLKTLRVDIHEVEKHNQLDYTVRSTKDDEIGQVGKSFKSLLKKFQHIIIQLSQSNHLLLDESSKLKVLSEQSNESVCEQFQMTSQVSSSIAHMTSALDQVSANINQVASNAGDVNQSAEKGKEVVSFAIAKLQELVSEISTATTVVNDLAESSEKVSKALEVITQIAEQTNLLALNAAIEAARAGEHGRGFAVVSDEVRTLATRTQESTKEIGDIIQQLRTGSENAISAMAKSQQQAEDTMTTTEGAGDSLNEITELSKDITEATGQVAVAAQGQIEVLKDINSNVDTLSQSADSAKAIAERTQQSALILSDNVDSTAKLVNTFKV